MHRLEIFKRNVTYLLSFFFSTNARYFFVLYIHLFTHDVFTQGRQIKNECGVGSKYSVDYDIVENVAKKIESGIYTVTNLKTFEDLPIGRDAFHTWMVDDITTADRIRVAQEISRKKKLDPDVKKCSLCKEEKVIDEFVRSQKYKDGRNKYCIDCIEKLANSSNKKSDRKTCYMCKKDLSVNSFDSGTSFCKNCRSKSRRAKRARDLKVN